MKQRDALFESAVQALRNEEPDAMQMAVSARRVAGRLGIDNADEVILRGIDSCFDVRQNFPAYRAGSLSAARAVLIDAHLHECSACRRQFRGGSEAAGVHWSIPVVGRSFTWHPRALGWTLAGALAVMVCSLFLYKAYWQVPPGVRAEVQSIDGTAYRISAAGERSLAAGDKLAEGENVRTGGGAHAVLQLADGSTVEVNERSVLGLGERGGDTTITLNGGALIVQAAKRTAGHLYVKTPDCRVAVKGTVFSVNYGIKGSRVAVLQGSVRVLHSGLDSTIQAGDQLTTNDNLSPDPLEKQIAWSHERAKYLPLLAAFDTIQKRIEQIPFPQPRYSSDLISKVPLDTRLYVSIPNLGEFLGQANQIFGEELKQSPALQEWWNRGHAQNTEQLDMLVSKIHEASQYLGDEVVVVGVKQDKNPGFAIIADVTKPGLADFLKTSIPSSGAGIAVVDSKSLNSLVPARKGDGGLALVLPNKLVVSNSVEMLKRMQVQLSSGDSGFESGAFGKQIMSAYGRGAGIILAADLHQIMSEKLKAMPASGHGEGAMGVSGMDGLQFLIAEHRELAGQQENQLAVQFSAARKGIASWLAAPAPIGSLEFVTPNAAIAVAGLSKDPADIASDIMSMTMADGGSDHGLQEIQEKLGINFRDDLAATLGGDFLVALDGPVLPTPSWKAVIEVRDSQRLEQTLEKLTQAMHTFAQENGESGKQRHSIVIESSEVNGQHFYSVIDQTLGNTVGQYTFSNGYMLVAPNRAILTEALHTYTTGNSLARSSSFRALLPRDANANYSAIAYQNLSPVLGPLLAQMSGESADAIRKLAADARPTAICARAEESRIEAFSDSRLFGFDFLTLGSLMNLGNHHPTASVRR